MNMPGIMLTKSMIRIEAIKGMLKAFDNYCAQEPNCEFKSKAREATDSAIAKLYESCGGDLEGTCYLHEGD